MGDTTFAPKTDVVCQDGCNTCRCEDGDTWTTTAKGCPPLSRAESCDGPPQHIELTTLLYRADDVLAIRLEQACLRPFFPGDPDARPPELKLCYSDTFDRSPAHTQVWLAEEDAEGITAVPEWPRIVIATGAIGTHTWN